MAKYNVQVSRVVEKFWTLQFDVENEAQARAFALEADVQRLSPDDTETTGNLVHSVSQVS